MANDALKSENETLGVDRALDPTDALEKDLLHRGGFARRVVSALGPLSKRSSFVVSVEGAWGSGKTSILAMAEEILRGGETKPLPVIVRFNPWLIGDRDALLQQFLAAISKAIKLTDKTATARKVAKEIDGYSKILGLVKYIPGAEPIASIVKSVLDATGKAASHMGDEKVHNIEDHKHRVENALKELRTRVIVLVDDIDRLYPMEAFEIIRIIKAVADLPNIGYIITLDPEYVSEALKSLGVPKAHSYLDKVIQTRLAVPMLPSSAKLCLLNAGLNELGPEVTEVYFARSEDLLAQAYHSGLRDMLEQPRDFFRLFNVLHSLEPELRGEVVLADIVAFSALSIKAPPVYALLRRLPNAFVGRMPNDFAYSEQPEETVARHADERARAYSQCESPTAVKELVYFLFPLVARSDDKITLGQVSLKGGRIAHPSRLVIALQLALTGADVSFRSIRRYINEPSARAEIAKSLTVDNCQDFLEILGDAAASRPDLENKHLESLAIDVARLVDAGAFAERRRNRREALEVSPWMAAIGALISITRRRGDVAGHLASLVACDVDALSAAANLVLAEDEDASDLLHIPKGKLEDCRRLFADNVTQAAADNRLFAMSSPGYVLYCLANVAPTRCAAVYAAIKANDPSLDAFALSFLTHSFDSVKGQTYRLPSRIELLTAFVPLNEFKDHAKQRLADGNVVFPTRAAWQSVIEQKSLYGVDGSAATR